MNDYGKILVSPNSNFVDVLRVINEGAKQIAFVVSEDNKLLGSVTDGDIRRGILKGMALDETINKVMNTRPYYIRKGELTNRERILEIKALGIKIIPILDENFIVIDVVTIDSLIVSNRQDNWVIIMAGGLGTRLRPLTENVPKPMLPIGGKPMLENIILHLKKQGFYKFVISVNYKKEIIQDYFKDGNDLDVKIKYITEDKQLGTAGAISLLDEIPTLPFIVMNGDILTTLNFNSLLESHNKENAKATMCVRDFEYQVPYGVIKTLDQKLVGIEEKPVQRFFVNAGIYVLNPEVINYIPTDNFYNMTDLFEELILLNKQTNIFPIREQWIDIGSPIEYEKASESFDTFIVRG
ncbi:MAG: Nucleotidyl transferase [Bacillales bacterium]|jgi:dTDP-glucose pyrophosphorylase|nr:Nucleotidyl transferase [Bacillales bacterium]